LRRVLILIGDTNLADMDETEAEEYLFQSLVGKDTLQRLSWKMEINCRPVSIPSR
jgi:hypothetical protein